MENNDNFPLLPVSPNSELLHNNEIILATDGTELVADLYIPGGKPPFPAVIEVTPYRAQALAKLGSIYARRGYLFLAVDTRGRYRSGGSWDPMTHDQSDGHAVVRWMAEHPLCNGRVGTRGHSYSGYNQLLCALDAPPALQAMVVCVAPGDPFENAPFHGGAYDIGDLTWLLGMSGRSGPEDFDVEEFGIKRFGSQSGTAANPYEQTEATQATDEESDQRDQARQATDAALAAAPFGNIDLRFGIRQETFRTWINHWHLDEYWRVRSAIARLERSSVPTLHISGWWDTNGRGATAAYRAMRNRAKTTGAREAQRLVMGPWNHDLQAPDCSALPADEAEQVRRAALHDELNDEFAWFDWHLKDIEPGTATRARTRLFVTGLYRWVEFDDWPPPNTYPTAYFISGATASGPGGLNASPPKASVAESAYVFDPGHPTPFAEPRHLGERAPFDNAAVERERDDLLLFDTAAATAPFALVGEPSLLLYARADVTDFDLCAKLLDVHPDGRAIYLTDGVIRARFRRGWDRPEPVVPHDIQAYRIDLWHLAHVVRSGHALRLEVSSSAFRRFDVNPCTGGSLATETERRVARIALLHTPAHPSQLELPVCRDPRLLR